MSSRASRVAVLKGGWSAEREVSLVSGRECANALREAGYDVTEIDAGRNLAEQLSEATPDVVFNALHGRWGEDGCVQGILEWLGIPYTRANDAPPLPVEYGALIQKTLGHLGCEIEIEPGRLIAGNAGLMVSKVIYVKSGEGRDFLILDGAMNDLIRPAMYEAHHDIVAVTEPAPGVEQRPYDIVGPVCETGDTFAKQRNMPPLAAGELVAFRSAGAYGAVMASEYNARPLIPEVMVRGDQFAVIRPRPTYAEMLGRDRLPPWLNG